ncbi:hypothetical protein DAPPUDRAFT_241981 [Daphnia pulex]|uniref:Uncharacterized protein n=1 Tax=Daphnia pulex TaxID=6669 RepID=E9GFJ6_DAPPU|nr:hypothetical protein DAPPUDRAFT_241981 [Daphnia pulex]|eukprot:EFX81648.1 hypothetical protein DAPPUDRAFT_241981 [Daphnia pulex]
MLRDYANGATPSVTNTNSLDRNNKTSSSFSTTLNAVGPFKWWWCNGPSRRCDDHVTAFRPTPPLPSPNAALFAWKQVQIAQNFIKLPKNVSWSILRELKNFGGERTNEGGSQEKKKEEGKERRMSLILLSLIYGPNFHKWAGGFHPDQFNNISKRNNVLCSVRRTRTDRIAQQPEAKDN